MDLDDAYLDAYRAAGEIWIEMSRLGEDASRHCFEITDVAGTLLLELPFSELLRRRGAARRPHTLPSPSVMGTTQKSHVLATDIAALVDSARRTIEETQSVLNRSRHKLC